MRYADEVLAPDRDQPIPEPASEPSARELDMARQLVSSLTGTFDPSKYRDEYREELLRLIDKKAAGEEIVASATPEEPAKVLDLMAALEASLARSGAKRAAVRGAGAEEADAGHGDEDAEDADEAPPVRRRAPAEKAARKKAPAKKTAAKKPATGKAPAKRTRKSA
jgi:DNA end-binding protein Ku